MYRPGKDDAVEVLAAEPAVEVEYVGEGESGAAVQFFDHLVRWETRLYNALDDQLRERHGVVTSQIEVLRHLRDDPHSRVADLAATFARGVGATSKGLDRLARREGASEPPTRPIGAPRCSLPPQAHSVEGAVVTFTTGVVELLAADASPPSSLPPPRLSLLRRALESDQVGTSSG